MKLSESEVLQFGVNQAFCQVSHVQTPQPKHLPSPEADPLLCCENNAGLDVLLSI